MYKTIIGNHSVDSDEELIRLLKVANKYNCDIQYIPDNKLEVEADEDFINQLELDSGELKIARECSILIFYVQHNGI